MMVDSISAIRILQLQQLLQWARCDGSAARQLAVEGLKQLLVRDM
jgi:hypothetical protein